MIKLLLLFIMKNKIKKAKIIGKNNDLIKVYDLTKISTEKNIFTFLYIMGNIKYYQSNLNEK